MLLYQMPNADVEELGPQKLSPLLSSKNNKSICELRMPWQTGPQKRNSSLRSLLGQKIFMVKEAA